MTDKVEINEQKDRPFRRTVFFISGFHDFGFRYFWPILKREARRHTKLYGRPIEAEETVTGAALQVDDFGQTVEVDYRYLAWNDIAQKRIKQPMWQLYWHMVARIIFYHLSGQYFRLMRAYWGFTNGVYYMLFTMLFASLIVFMVAYITLPIPELARIFISLLMAYFIPSLGYESMENYFRIKLMWLIFRMTLEQKNGTCTDLLDRMADFEGQILAEAQKDQADEILIIGHSYGSILATELAARVQKRLDEGNRQHSPLALFTIGDINALFVIAGASQSFKDMLIFASTSKKLSWHCAFSPQDGLNFPKYNVANEDLGIADTTGPHFHSLKLKEVSSPETYKRLKKSFWDMHFQYFRESDYQNNVSYFRAIGAAKPLADNFSKRPEEIAFAKKMAGAQV